MRLNSAILGVLATFASQATASGQSAPPELNVEPHLFESRGGETVDAEIGRFFVPENRDDPDSRLLELAFVRFASTSETPGNPIVYLAGGPGGSGTGTAAGRRFEIFMALREQADVIAFDQRGTGLSQSPPDCIDEDPPGLETPLTRETMVAYFQEETARCVAWWREQGVDINGWNTAQSAADIDDLRLAIGADDIDLWAISYGAHLGAAYLRAFEDHVGRAVFAGYEGPDDTVKLPSRTDALLTRVADLIAADPEASAAYPDLIAMMRRVLTRLEAEPVEVTVASDDGDTPRTMTLGAFPIQLLTGYSISDPFTIARLPAFFAAMDAGQYEQAAASLRQILFSGPASMRAMSTAMDYASGVSPVRLAQVEEEAASAVLGDALNFPMPHIWGVAPDLDLGEEFRAPLSVETEILFISGTLDGRTSPDAVRDALPHLPNAQHLVVENGGHNIYEADPRMTDVVRDWLREGVAPDSMTFAPPRFLIPG